jgi:serine phosphatase RsbU (regulator of sigma subunit)
MILRSSRVGWLLLAAFLAANAGVLLLDFAPPNDKVYFLLLFLGEIVVFLPLWTVYAAVVRAEREQRNKERKMDRLELQVDDSTPETMVLKTLSDISVQFLERVQLMPLLKRMSAAAREVLGADVCALEIFTESDKPVRFLEGTGTLTFGDEVYKRVREQGSSLLINNITHHKRYVAIAEQNLLGMVVAPFEIRGKVIGMIGVFSRKEGNFIGRDLHLLQVFAQHGALLIEATQLMEGVRRLSLRSDSEDIADLVHLRARLSQERELADYEMSVAHRIQTDLLPDRLPEIPDARLEAYSLPAKEVGGDFYDVLELGDDRWALAIGDVSGKGVPAALVTVMSQTVLHLLAKTESSPAAILTKLNETLYRETPAGMFLSMFYGIWDRSTGLLRYCNAGHEHPLLYVKAEDAVREIVSDGVALGALDDAKAFLDDSEIRLMPGDVLLLYTDGVVEAKNRGDSMFGIERLREDVAKLAGQTGYRYLNALKEDVDRFVAGAEQHDDITMLSLYVSPPDGDS